MEIGDKTKLIRGAHTEMDNSKLHSKIMTSFGSNASLKLPTTKLLDFAKVVQNFGRSQNLNQNKVRDSYGLL